MANIDDQAIDWVARQSKGGLSQGEQTAFETWYDSDARHQGAYLRAQGLWQSLDGVQIDQAWIASEPALMSGERRPDVSRRRLLFGASGVAAVAAGLAGWAMLSRPKSLVTHLGEFRKIPLPDQSVASLNTSSHIEVAVTPKVRRVVLVEGEAWFAVAKDPLKPFVVEVDDVRVKAVGTAFSVRRKAAGVEVIVTEGIVETWREDQHAEPKRIEAGEEAFVSTKTAAIDVSANDQAEARLAWRTGNIVLQNDTLSEAADEFNRYNTQKIVVADPGLLQEKFVGVYHVDNPGQFAQAVKMLLNVPVNVSSERIVIGEAKDSSKINNL
jgi:transmembrane sensor